MFIFLILLAGGFTGLLTGYVISQNRLKVSFQIKEEELKNLHARLSTMLPKSEVEENFISRKWFDACQEQLKSAQENLKEKDKQLLHLVTEAGEKVSKSELQKDFVPKPTYDFLARQYQTLESKSATDQKYLDSFREENSKLKEAIRHADENLAAFKQELTQLQELSRDSFKTLAQEILKDKSKDFVETNRQSLDSVLAPFKTQLDTFQQKVESTRKEDIVDLTSLKKEIESLQKLNVQLSEDAQKLTGALKSDVKIQGDWGEDRLKYLLEAEGLSRHVDYSTQGAYKDEEEGANRRPDFILNLPDGKHIIIDSKVSLNAYVEYFNCTDAIQKKDCIKRLVKNILDHIDGLSAKNYQSLAGLSAPDFVCMFMAVEPALSLAISEHPDILKRAMDKKVIIITPTTAMAALKMIKLIWQKENRIQNVEEIFKQCGLLYDKFVTFVEEFQKIGGYLDASAITYKSAMDRLTEGARKGDTIVGRFERLKELEARTNKSLPANLLREVDALEGGPMTIEVAPGETVVVNTQLG